MKKEMSKDLMTIVGLDGTRQENVRGLVAATILIPGKSVDVASGYRIEVPLQNGRTSTYLVEEVRFIAKELHFPAHYQVKARHLPAEPALTEPLHLGIGF